MYQNVEGLFQFFFSQETSLSYDLFHNLDLKFTLFSLGFGISLLKCDRILKHHKISGPFIFILTIWELHYERKELVGLVDI